MAISVAQVELWLASTIGSEEGDLHSAAQSLENAQSVSAFPFILLTISTGSVEEGRKLAAATYLKNLLKAQWHKPGFLSSDERHDFRNKLADALLRSDHSLLKALNEAFRSIIDNDFVRENTWPEVVPSMKIALQNSSLLNGQNAEISTFNVLTAVQTMIRPFQYFMNPKLAKEPVPEQLELLSAQLLVPLNQLFQILVAEAKTSKERGTSANDNSLLVICKCFHLAVRAHMPSALQPYLGKWCQNLFTVLETVQLQHKVEDTDQFMRMKAWKRTLQIFCTMVTRHRKHVDKILPTLSTILMDLLAKAATLDLHPLQERVISSMFDTLSNILETGPGWRLISSHFSSLLEGAIFPALRLKEKDLIDWNEDPEEYARKNLPSDMDYTSGWREDLYTPRRSALNLLGLISTSKGPPTAIVSKNVSPGKRKKSGKSAKSKESHGTVGELLVLPFLSRFPLPPDGCTIASETVSNYYGVLLACGGIQEFFKTQKPDRLPTLLRSHVLPLYSMSSPSPFLLANANWLLGEFASFLPEDLGKEIYNALVKAFLAPDGDNTSWRPVRNSAAAAISALLEEEFKPAEWLPVLQAAVTGARSEDNDDATTALQVLTKTAEAAGEEILPHIPTIILAVKEEVYRRIPDIPEPWPQVVESGFSAIVGLAQTWDSAVEEIDVDEAQGCTAIGRTISELLQKAWLNYPEDINEAEVSPPSSCLNETSALIVMMVKYATDAEKVVSWRIEQLLYKWSDLIADWSAWEEEEDIAVFEAITEIISLQERLPLAHFGVASMPAVPALPVQPRSILEGIATFIRSGIEVAYPAATWRACRLGHAILHVVGISFESDDLTPMLADLFFRSASKRLVQLSSTTVPLAKPLILLISMCYVCSPNSVMRVLAEISESRESILVWVEALAKLAERSEAPMISLESEIKLTVAALLRLLSDVCGNHIDDRAICGLKHTFLHSLLTACIRLQQLEGTDEDDDNGEGQTDNEEEEEEEEETDDEDEDDDSEDDEKSEETEEQFLERYAQKAQELEKEAIEEAEGGEEEDGQELEIGVLGLTEPIRMVYTFLESHGRELMTENQLLTPDFRSEFLEFFPEFDQLFPQ